MHKNIFSKLIFGFLLISSIGLNGHSDPALKRFQFMQKIEPIATVTNPKAYAHFVITGEIVSENIDEVISDEQYSEEYATIRTIIIHPKYSGAGSLAVASSIWEASKKEALQKLNEYREKNS